jgi:hypothetical protein
LLDAPKPRHLEAAFSLLQGETTSSDKAAQNLLKKIDLNFYEHPPDADANGEDSYSEDSYSQESEEEPSEDSADSEGPDARRRARKHWTSENLLVPGATCPIWRNGSKEVRFASKFI